jgi:hypothetical protein
MAENRSPKRGFFENIADEIQKGYRLEDERLKSESAPIEKQMQDAASESAVDLLNPIKWVRAIFFG